MAILEGLGGLVLLLGALAVGAGGALFGGPLVLFGGVIAAALVVIALIAFGVAYSFWTGQSWGWWLGLILGVLQVLSGLVTFPAGILGLAIGIIVLYYLTRPHVKAWFHEA